MDFFHLERIDFVHVFETFNFLIDSMKTEHNFLDFALKSFVSHFKGPNGLDNILNRDFLFGGLLNNISQH